MSEKIENLRRELTDIDAELERLERQEAQAANDIAKIVRPALHGNKQAAHRLRGLEGFKESAANGSSGS
jgi:hypothetical protein